MRLLISKRQKHEYYYVIRESTALSPREQTHQCFSLNSPPSKVVSPLSAGEEERLNNVTALTEGSEVKRVSRFKFLGVNISEDLPQAQCNDAITKKVQQWLYFIRSSRRFGVRSKTLANFYRCTTESILAVYIVVWYGGAPAQDWREKQKVVSSASSVMGIENFFKRRCLKIVASVTKDPHHPEHALFSLLSSGRRCRSLKMYTQYFRKRFLSTAIRILNGQ
ncbi:uncharacterized protein LOC132378146 [Hypanus sabinus]|uniref:uncharacterized protein LOC132378146 n=1 Tax=Hypanus sabinus TaxID=79690 RepID=UPI0028C430C0|nr:uncharacterized protein LOC132378146 [Hypanus sabinus]